MEAIDFIKDCKNDFEKVDLLISTAKSEAKKKPEKSLDILKEAVIISNSIDYLAGKANAKLQEGICHRQLSNFDSAIKCYNESLGIYKSIENLNGEIRSLNSIGNVYYCLSDYNRAIDYFNICVEKQISFNGDKAFLATIYSNIGLVYQEMNDISSSLASYYEALNIYTDLNKTVPHSLYNNIGIVYQEIGDFIASVQYFKMALQMEDNEGNLIYQCSTLGNIGISYIKSGDFLNGVTYLGEALIIARLTGNRQSEASIYNHLGNAYKYMKSYQLAVDYKLKALRYNRGINDKSAVSGTLCRLGKIYFELNDYKSSKESYIEALEIAIGISDTINEVKIYIGLAELYNKFADQEMTENYLRKAEKLSKFRNADRELMKIHAIYSECYKNGGVMEKAAYHLELNKSYAKKLLEFDDEKKLRKLLLGKIFDDIKLTKGNCSHAISNLKSYLPNSYSEAGLKKN